MPPSSVRRADHCVDASRMPSSRADARNPRRPLRAQELPQGVDRDSRAAGRRAGRSARASSSSIVGPSGCGKSTLLHLLGTLDAPDAGEICFEGNRIDNLPAAGRDILRNQLLRHDLSVLSPAAGAHDARKRARAGDDRRGRVRLSGDRRGSIASGPARCSSWSASAIG